MVTSCAWFWPVTVTGQSRLQASYGLWRFQFLVGYGSQQVMMGPSIHMFWSVMAPLSAKVALGFDFKLKKLGLDINNFVSQK